ncbi:hypothetical protein VTN77DRAFT_5528 [Rasamsonia byssochlamydoides]|uniref:uncharacterized protein n=1 Tax=Rasamsonia byssochlamydoides TaxID=89139 RepID=UPI00374384EB
MVDETTTTTTDSTPRWRISKACQECRRRKIRCDGGEPCKHCKQRKAECIYRGFVRQRKRKHELISSKSPDSPLSLDPTGTAQSKSSGPSRNILHHSVAATHMASPSCIIQLYYGPTSNFSLMQLMYRQLVEGVGDVPEPAGSEVEEAGPGLDLFSHRRLFFGDLAGNQDTSTNDSGLIFIHPSLASQYLERYLSTTYYLMPFAPKEEYRRRLEQLYSDPRTMALESPDVTIMLLILASGAAMMEEEERAEFLFKKAKANAAKFEELVNLQAIQIPLMMAHYQSERARPNSSYLHLGTAVRKALAAGLHKDTHFQAERSKDDVEQKRTTFWSLYFYESWICLGLGRPSSIPENEISIPDPTEQPFLLALVQLSRIMCKSAQNIYGQRHESLLPMWKAAKEIRRALQVFSQRLCDVMNFGLESSPKAGELGVCQTVLLLLYHNLLLLTFRPFLVFRARWRDGQSISKNGEKPFGEQATPLWLDEACEYCLEAARCTIRYLSEAYEINKLVREIKYHAFFLEGACFTLAFDMMHNKESAFKHLPWVKSGLRCLAAMLPRNQFYTQVTSTMSAIQKMLQSVFPSLGADVVGLESSPDGFKDEQAVSFSELNAQPDTLPHQPQPQAHDIDIEIDNPSAFFTSLGQNLMTMRMPIPIGGVGISDTVPSTDSHNSNNNQDDLDLVDFTQADMGWNFDFSTMDLEAFLSIDPSREMEFVAR